MKTSAVIKPFLDSLTHHPGVYQMLGDAGEILYIGKARDLKKRVSSYFSAKTQDTKTRALLKHVKEIQVTITHTEDEALLLECDLIKKHKPHYNVLFRDDKSYPYIVIDNSEFPRIDFYRGNKKKQGMYFGPYPNATAVRETIQLIQKLFQLRTCSDNFFARRTRPCLQYQIGRCTGPCVGLISAEEYQQNVQHAILFLQGKNQEIIVELSKKMQAASENLNFELAAKLRDQMIKLRQIQAHQSISSADSNSDVIGFALSAGIVCLQLLVIRGGRILGSRSFFPSIPAGCSPEEIITSFLTQHYLTQDTPKKIILDRALPEQDWLETALKTKIVHRVRGERKKWLEMAILSAKQAVSSRLIRRTNTQKRFNALQELLKLPKKPQRIECFDVSHTQGEATVASCVVFNHDGPVKSDYRRYNITGVTAGDDIHAMQQALQRRYKHLEKLPDIVLIDGGTAQLNIAKKVLGELDVLLIGVAKGVTRKPGYETLHLPNRAPIHLSSDSITLHLIQQIRDEAHRFAITGHRLKRDKTRRVSSLESIPGIGAKRRRELLQYFGGIQAINRASLDELAKVPGISAALAQRIFDALH